MSESPFDLGRVDGRFSRPIKLPVAPQSFICECGYKIAIQYRLNAIGGEMLEIREIRAGEYDFLREMLYEAIYIPAGSEKPPESIVNSPHFLKYCDNFGRKGDFAYVLTDENILVGAAWARIFSTAEAGYGFVDEETPELSIAIREKYRSRGFGGLMIQKLFGKLKSQGIEKVSLSVDKRNRAVNLYERNGFEIISEEGTAFTMVKKL